ncbi:MAG: phosphate acetyltransferase [Clostridia bacterium]
MEINNITKELIERAKITNKKIILPESDDLRIINAAKYLSDENICEVILIGSLSDIEFLCNANSINLDFEKIKVINPSICENKEFYINSLYELRKNKGMTLEQATTLLLDNMYFGIMMLKVGDADGLVAGAKYSTKEVIKPALQIIKAKDKVNTVSSFFIMDVPNFDKYIFADCGLNKNPSSEQLADIAISSSNSYRNFIGSNPKVALLSYSTCGSAVSEDIEKIKDAVSLLDNKKVDFDYEGELQVDAAVIKDVAHKKINNSKLNGSANILIFPDLNSGNIGYKLVQIFAKATAIGPITQGMSKPVNDLSRGCSIEDIIGVVAVTCIQV